MGSLRSQPKRLPNQARDALSVRNHFQRDHCVIDLKSYITHYNHRLISRNTWRGTRSDGLCQVVRFDIPRPIVIRPQQNKQTSRSSGEAF